MTLNDQSDVVSIEVDLLSVTSGAICRICQDEGNSPLIRPCACAGSVRFSHEECLARWIRCSGRRQCEVCLTKYRLRSSGLKNPCQWKFPKLHCTDRLHISLFALCVFFIGSSLTWVGWTLTSTDRVAIAYRNETLGLIAYAMYGPLDVLCLFICIVEVCFFLVPLYRRFRAHNESITILEYQPGLQENKISEAAQTDYRISCKNIAFNFNTGSSNGSNRDHHGNTVEGNIHVKVNTNKTVIVEINNSESDDQPTSTNTSSYLKNNPKYFDPAVASNLEESETNALAKVIVNSSLKEVEAENLVLVQSKQNSVNEEGSIFSNEQCIIHNETLDYDQIISSKNKENDDVTIASPNTGQDKRDKRTLLGIYQVKSLADNDSRTQLLSDSESICSTSDKYMEMCHC